MPTSMGYTAEPPPPETIHRKTSTEKRPQKNVHRKPFPEHLVRKTLAGKPLPANPFPQARLNKLV
jgi:hypothetical protein